MKPEIIAVNPNPQTPPGVTITLENLGIFLGILVSLSLLIGVAIKGLSAINRISSSIEKIEEDLKEQAKVVEKARDLEAEYIERLRMLHAEFFERLSKAESRLDLHMQDYVNRKDVVQMVMGQLDEKINHKFKRLLFYTRDMQRFLQKGTEFMIREYEENEEEE